MPQPYSIKIFLPAGEPNGLRILERPNWTGIGVAFNRTGFAEAAARDELRRAGVYILAGEHHENGALPSIYIGEGDPILDRLRSHNADRDFWSKAVAFTSKDGSLNKAHIQYLEHRLIDAARRAGLCRLENANMPQPPSLTEPDTADMGSFLQIMLSILPLTDLTFFEPAESRLPAAAEEMLYLRRRGVAAQAVQRPEGFVVLKGSQAALHCTPSCYENFRRTREDLLRTGLLRENGAGYTFTKDVTFSSPSYAACIVLGASTNGRTAWTNAAGENLNMQAQREQGE